MVADTNNTINNDVTSEDNESDKNTDTSSSGSKTLVVYYSAQNHTKAVSEKIAENLNADIFEIEPEEKYTSEDLNWTNNNSRVSKEHNDESLRNVKLTTTEVENWEEYDTVLIGYPIWWGIAAWPVDTFVKANDFSGKTIIPFCTSASSGLGESGKLLKEEANGGNWLDGHRFSSNQSDSYIKAWTDSIKSELNITDEQETSTGNTLVAYFSLPETRGDAKEDSTITVNGEDLGNTQYVANLIVEHTGADLFRIEPVKQYNTSDHQALIDDAKEEQNNDARPEIKNKINNFDGYDTIFIGYPIWWSDLPQILYTFLESYDFTGKNVYLFSTNGGSGLASTVSTITNKLDGAKVNQNAFKLYRENMEDAPEEVESWLKEIDIIK